MADNPYADRPKNSKTTSKNQCPPDMPTGDSEADKAARQRYWIERGNEHLAAIGKSHLHWCCSGGDKAHYWIEERA